MGESQREKNKVYEGVFDEFTLRSLETLKRKKYFDSLLKPIKTGKEADVYLASYQDETRAIKIYRVTSANFKNISTYISRDFRFKSVRGNIRKVIMRWIEKEYRNLVLCHKAQMNVPYPFAVHNNCIVMERINGLMLKDTELEDPQKFFELVFEQLHLLTQRVQLIHGDLSEFNILVRDQEPVIIDFGQSMTIKNEEDFKMHYDLFQRDITNIVSYFNKRYKLNLDKEEILEKLKNK